MINPEQRFISLDKTVAPGSILENLDNQLELARKLKPVYDNRPDIKSFVGAMPGTKYEGQYTAEVIKKDEKYVKDTQEKIRKDDSSFGQANLDYLEKNFQLSEIMQAMIVDLINNNWFKDCQAIMTTEYDDLAVGIDAVMKHKRGGYLGASFDFTVTNKDKRIYEKLEGEWENTKRGKVQTIKYFEDPDTKQKSRLLVPKFIIGASKKDVEELAQAYLTNDQETLANHPFKYIMLLQIEEQLQTVLDYYETTDREEQKFEFAKKQYERIQSLLRNLKQEIHLDERMKEVDLHEYSKNSVALDMMRRFRIMRDSKTSRTSKPE